MYYSLGFLPSCFPCSLASRQLGKGTTQVGTPRPSKNTSECNEEVFITNYKNSNERTLYDFIQSRKSSYY